MRNKPDVNKFRRVFSAEQWKELNKDKTWRRKVLGYICILKICCICVLSALTQKVNLDRIDKHPFHILMLNYRSLIVWSFKYSRVQIQSSLKGEIFVKDGFSCSIRALEKCLPSSLGGKNNQPLASGGRSETQAVYSRTHCPIADNLVAFQFSPFFTLDLCCEVLLW